jgi:localization factor PodJL
VDVDTLNKGGGCRMNMQPDLPWSVAGIPPEAREAARAAARREGLAVGEWLTRRILRSFTDASSVIGDAERVSWRSEVAEAPRAPVRESSTSNETENMLAHVQRSGNEAQNAYKNIDQQLMAVARRLEAAERSQTEQSRAMSTAASQINVAAREQAQAFDQLNTNVTALSDRLVRVERTAADGGLKDAVKGLHQGLARVADQVAQTANQSASQIATLATTVEQLATKVVETRNDAEETAHAVAQAAAQNVEQQLQVRLEQKLSQLDERIRIVERTAFASASALDRVLEDVDRVRAGKDVVDAEFQRHQIAIGELSQQMDRLHGAKEAGDAESQRHHAAMSDLSQQMDRLAGRLAGIESEHAGSQARLAGMESDHADAQARFEETAHRLETSATSAHDHRFTGIEQALSDIVARLQENEQEKHTIADQVDQAMRELAVRFEEAEHGKHAITDRVDQVMRDFSGRYEAADRRTRDMIESLQDSLRDANAKIAALEASPVLPSQGPAFGHSAPAFAAAHPAFAPEPAFASTSEPEDSPYAAHAAFDAPPFPEHEPMSQHEEAIHEPPPFDQPHFESAQPAFAGEGFATAPAFGAEAFANTAHAADFSANESFLSAARRSARNAAAAHVDPAPATGFSWGLSRSDQSAEGGSSNSRMRYALIGIAAIVAMIVVAAGLMLSRGVISPAPNAAPANGPFAARPSMAPPAQTDDESGAGSATSTSSQSAAPPATTPSAPPATTTKPAPQKQAAATPQAAAAAPVSPVQKLTQLANTGDAKSELLLGIRYLDGDGVAANEAEASRWLSRAAQQGEPMAQYRLGTLYERGKGVPADAKLANHWYELAAKQGNRKAMHNLAVAFADGSGEPKDYNQAAAWFSRAANLGLVDSQFNLAVLYERGMGVKQSLVDAYKWYAIAAAQGDSESKSRIDALSSQIKDSDRAAAQAAATRFHPQPMNPAANSLPVTG